jgi:hypothetical protein
VDSRLEALGASLAALGAKTGVAIPDTLAWL